MRQRTHEKAVAKKYGLQPGQYELLYEAQGRQCFICQRAKGYSKALCVDHDHATGKVRGLLCDTCNRIVVGRYDIAALKRAIEYLESPPAQRVLV